MPRRWRRTGARRVLGAPSIFDNLIITRGIVVVEGNYVACQTTIAGTFVREFTHSPVGPLPPNGNRVTFELINIFRYDDAGCLAEL